MNLNKINELNKKIQDLASELNEMMSKPLYAYSESLEVVGVVTEVDLDNGVGVFTYDAVQEKSESVNLDDLKFLELITQIENEPILNHDLFEVKDGRVYEVLLEDDGHLSLSILDEELEVLEKSTQVFTTENIEKLVTTGVLTLICNRYEVELEENVEVDTDFNIKVVKEVVNGGNKYYYACNNIQESKIDLIKVVFIGAKLIEGELYERVTLEVEDFVEFMSTGQLEDVTPSELQSHAMSLMYPKAQEPKVESYACVDECKCGVNTDDCEYPDCEDDEDFCAECGEDENSCYCFD